MHWARIPREEVTAKMLRGSPFGELAQESARMLFGNVGTQDRLDFTATRQAVVIVSRCEAMTRQLQVPILGTDSSSEAGLHAG